MGIYIKGMEMPKDCPMCPLAHWNKVDNLTGCEIVRRYVPKNDTEYWQSDSRPAWCPLIEVPSHEFARCTCEDSIQENGINLISEWATKGIDLAGEYGKTIDDLIVFLKAAYGMKMLFDLIGKQPKDGE